LEFSIGSDAKVGADGLAFWYTKERAQPGPVMGNIDRWTGLGIIVDTFDNDGQRDNPQIYAVFNDHSFTFDPSTDGKSNILGNCYANIRQTTAYPEDKTVRLLVRIQDKMLYVAYDNTAALNTLDPTWTDCFKVPINIENPLSGYYLGVTAETGGLSDIHDIRSLQTYSFIAKSEEFPGKDDKELGYKAREERALGRDKEQKSKKQEDNPANEFSNRLAELEKRDDTFETTLENNFKEMKEKIQFLENDQIQVLSRLDDGLESIRQTVDFNKLDELKKDVQKALGFLDSLSTRLDNIELYVHGTNKKNAELHGLHDSGSEILEAAERSSNWGFWTYFFVLQFVIWVFIIWWKRSQDEESIKIL